MIRRRDRSRPPFPDAVFVRDWHAAFGDYALLPNATTSRHMREVGWTSGDTQAAIAIGRHASASPGGSAGLGLTAVQVASGLLVLGLPRPEAFAWARLFVTSRGSLQLQALGLLWDRHALTPDSPVCAWSRRLGSLGPPAWAAGLTLDEAATLHSAGNLDTMALQTMAALRGYRLPG